jgi:phage tail-like protein
MPSSDLPLGADPPIASRFLFEIDGVEIGIFREVSGLQVTVEMSPIKEGGQNGYVHNLPGRMTWPNIIFKRGLTQSDNLFAWLGKTSGEGFAGAGNKVTRSTGAITAITLQGVRLRAWKVQQVLPVRWKGPDFATTSSAILEEELEITHHGFKAETY